jgi:hypothetical protein
MKIVDEHRDERCRRRALQEATSSLWDQRRRLLDRAGALGLLPMLARRSAGKTPDDVDRQWRWLADLLAEAETIANTGT